MKVSLAQDSRRGARRANQDRVGHWRTAHSLLMTVADGLGGHQHGELAAQLAVDFLGVAFQREARPKLADPARFLDRVLRQAHSLIVAEAEKRGLATTPRTVIAVAVVQGGQLYWTHIGDCRLYLFRKGVQLARTRDHTVVQQLVDEGRIREEAVAAHPARNRLLQCLGGFPAPRAEPVATVPLAKDDIVLLCSDGFWAPLAQRQLLHALLSRPLPQAVPELADLAERLGGPECDNVSVLAMAWGEEEVAPPFDGPSTVPYQELPQESAAAQGYSDMSDEDIDQAIAELKAVLRKHGPAQ